VKKSRRIIFFVCIFIFISSIPASAASPSFNRETQPWTIQTIDNDEPGVQNLSAAYVGSNQVPISIYTKNDGDGIYYVHRATEAIPGNCGPNDGWFCSSYGTNLIESTLSNLATLIYAPNYFTLKYAYASDNGKLYATARDKHDDMTTYSTHNIFLVDLTRFGDELIGAPSLQAYEDEYRIAFSIVDFIDPLTPPQYKLVYVYKTGQDNNSCNDSPSLYQCDVIETSGYELGPPSLQVSPKESIGIAYEKGGALTYAYPHEHLDLFPSNCGPGDPKTWRCITIYDDANVGSDVQLAFGQTRGRGIVYNRDSALGFAQYVGSGGNCGWDGHHLVAENQWQCFLLAGFENNPNPSYSIAIDPKGYPVIAYDSAPEALGPKNLNIKYQLGHIGLEPSNAWGTEVIDRAPSIDVDNGREAAIALNNLGMGFIVYMQDDNWDPYNPIDRLKVAVQPIFRNYLPMIVD